MINQHFTVSFILFMFFRHARVRKYGAELQRCQLEATPSNLSITPFFLSPPQVTDSRSRRGGRKGSTSSSSSSSSSVAMDPLSSMMEGTDPLSLFAAASASEVKQRENEDEVGADFEPWSAKRGEILSRFTTTEKLSIVRNIFPLISCSPSSEKG
uniref:VPS35 endosomal protein-sorting factor-like n=1 Tax=Astyanax mexicanus TaxID=7994 RepID=A0A3B1JQY8_ASTMX